MFIVFKGYVTELLLTLEAAVDSLESDFRPLDFMKEIFKSTPNLNKEGVGGKRSPLPPVTCNISNNHMRSTSYSVPYAIRKATGSPNLDSKGIEGIYFILNRFVINLKKKTIYCFFWKFRIIDSLVVVTKYYEFICGLA